MRAIASQLLNPIWFREELFMLRFICVLALGLLITSALMMCPQKPSGFVKVKGTDFVLPDGKTFLLRGINLGNWLVPEGYMWLLGDEHSPRQINDLICQLVGETDASRFWSTYRDQYIQHDDIRLIRKSGFNSIRIPFDYRLFVQEGATVRYEGPGYALLDRLISWCREEQVYVILDMHAAPGGQTGYNIDNSWGYPFLFEDPTSQEIIVELWKRLAQRYKNETIVIGYDLLNEPIADFYKSASLNSKLEPLYKKITKAIRSVNTNHVIFYGGAQWNTNFDVFGPPFDANAAYTFHLYLTEPTAKVFQQFMDFRDKYKVPIWLGESGENTAAWTVLFRTALESNQVGWCFWPYKKLEIPGNPGPVHAYGSCVATVKIPENWSKIQKFSQGSRINWKELRSTRPSNAEAQQILSEFLENVKIKNCSINDSYLQALGVRSSAPH